MSVDVKYRSTATATGGGRDGHSASADGTLAVDLKVPKELGGPGGGVNPETLFATGYAACFLGAMKAAAGKTKTPFPADASVTATVGIGPRSDGTGFGLTVDLTVSLPGLDRAVAEDVMTRGHVICPYAHATKGNIATTLTLA